MLSSEMARVLGGRYIPKMIMPFSLSEANIDHLAKLFEQALPVSLHEILYSK